MLTPYVDATNERLRGYLEESGHEVTDLRGLAILDMYSHAEVTSGDLYRAARGLEIDNADAVFIACTQLKTIDILDALESDLGIPVVSAVQASFWAALVAIGGVGLPIVGYGTLLRES